VALAERSADGLVEAERLEAAHLAARREAEQQAAGPRQLAARLAAAVADPFILRPGRPEALASALERLAVVQVGQGTFEEAFAALVDDVFGPPSRAEFRWQWRTPTVVALTRRVLDERDEVAILVLADALEEAGCAEDALLEHCRSGVTHVRGCWALDAILGKS
jgi:hypothetical protein